MPLPKGIEPPLSAQRRSITPMNPHIPEPITSSPTSEVDVSPTATQSSRDTQASKKADLAGPGIGDYAELEKILPQDYHPLLTPKETQKAIFHLRRYIEDNLCKELGLMMVQVPLIVDVESGVNDMLDRDGSRTPFSSTSPMTETRIPLTPRSFRPRPSGSVSPSSNSTAAPAKASALTCALSAKTTSSITITPPMSISGIGSELSPPNNVIWNS